MKKIRTLFLIAFFSTSFLFADVKGIFTVNSFFNFNNFPNAPFHYNSDSRMYLWDRANTSTWNNLNNDWWMNPQDYWLMAYEKPNFLGLGFEVNSPCFNLILNMDIAQDFLKNLTEQSSINTNIPFIGPIIDLTFPRVSYLDFKSPSENFYASVGRRLIKWGPGSYDFAISDSQAYLDNIYLNYTTPFSKDSKWNFDFNYVLISPKFWFNYDDESTTEDDFLFQSEKTILAHKFTFYTDFLRLSIGELANIYNKSPSFFDLTPLVIWHNGNQDEFVNVALYFSAEGKAGPIRLFGTYFMDDFDLPHETHSGKPLAMGFNAGIEYHIFDGKPINSNKFTKKDYTLKEDNLKTQSGLNVGFEWYHSTPMLYNREPDQAPGKFTIPFQIISLQGENYSFDSDAFFLGFKYGPNARLFRLYAEYTDNPFEARFAAEILSRGLYNISSAYGDRDKLDEMGVINMLKIAGAQTTALLLDIDFAYYLQESLKLIANVDLQFDFTHKKNVYQIGIGISCDPFFTDWKNLFSK